MRNENCSSQMAPVEPGFFRAHILSLLPGMPRLQGQPQVHFPTYPDDIHLSFCRILLPELLPEPCWAMQWVAYHVPATCHLAFWGVSFAYNLPSWDHAVETVGCQHLPKPHRCRVFLTDGTLKVSSLTSSHQARGMLCRLPRGHFPWVRKRCQQSCCQLKWW